MALANSLNYRFQPRVQHLFQKPNLASGKNYFDCVRDTTLVVVHDWSFKDGAFKDKIAKDTPVSDSFQILIDSPLTTAGEKENFTANHILSSFGKNFPGAAQPGFADIYPFLSRKLR